nr:TetR/AcrR family transcriptional regulator [uncultured Hyphomonas sp.]
MTFAPGTPRPPQQDRSTETRARILDAALSSFAEQGFEAANIRDISEKANVTHPMITYHFGNKDKLWRAAVEEMFERMSREVILPTQAPGQDPVEQLKAMVRQYVRYCAIHPEHARITIAETVRGGERLDWMVEQFVKNNHHSILPLIETVMDTGYLPKMPIVSFLYALVGMCQLPFVLAREASAAFKIDMQSEQMIEQHIETVFQLLFREAPGGAS